MCISTYFAVVVVCFSLRDFSWGDHCGQVEQNCKEEDTGKSPATLRTPYGLGEQEWRKGLEVYAKKFGS
jgi:hypothetical protein